MSDFYLTLPSHSSKTEFPNNTSNHFKIRLPHPKELEGSGWKVRLTAISLPDSHCRVPVFTSGKYPLFKMGWKRISSPSVANVYKDYNPEDVLVNFDAVNGVGFMKSMVNFFEKNRISDDGAMVIPRLDGRSQTVENELTSSSSGKETNWSPITKTQLRLVHYPPS